MAIYFSIHAFTRPDTADNFLHGIGRQSCELCGMQISSRNNWQEKRNELRGGFNSCGLFSAAFLLVTQGHNGIKTGCTARRHIAEDDADGSGEQEGQ
jgi:hypothetical protein